MLPTELVRGFINPLVPTEPVPTLLNIGPAPKASKVNASAPVFRFTLALALAPSPRGLATLTTVRGPPCRKYSFAV